MIGGVGRGLGGNNTVGKKWGGGRYSPSAPPSPRPLPGFLLRPVAIDANVPVVAQNR